MASITQEMRYRKAVITYAENYGVTLAARKYSTYRQYIYRWKNRYDGTWESLRNRSRRPHHHPNEHTIYSFEDFSKQLKVYNRRDYNKFPMRPLGWKSPKTILTDFVKWGVTYV